MRFRPSDRWCTRTHRRCCHDMGQKQRNTVRLTLRVARTGGRSPYGSRTIVENLHRMVADSVTTVRLTGVTVCHPPPIQHEVPRLVAPNIDLESVLIDTIGGLIAAARGSGRGGWRRAGRAKRLSRLMAAAVLLAKRGSTVAAAASLRALAGLPVHQRHLGALRLLPASCTPTRSHSST